MTAAGGKQSVLIALFQSLPDFPICVLEPTLKKSAKRSEHSGEARAAAQQAKADFIKRRIAHRWGNPVKTEGITSILLFIISIVFTSAIGSAVSFAQTSPLTTARDVLSRLDAWDLPGAEKILAPILRSDPTDPEVRFAAAAVAFHRGMHQEALKDIEGIDVPEEDGRFLMALIRSSASVTDKYIEARSTEGHFRLLYPPGPDAILIKPVLETLEKARTAVGADLHFTPPEEITVEVVHTASELAAMTGLREEEIRATNTIAVCKYNRIMFTSPEALAAGYQYLDTLTHEYTHYVVSRKAELPVEIWLHEAIAKMEETSWRGKQGSLRPDHEGLISAALSRGDVIPFAKMSPSMAKLPDVNAAALAFAEVFSAGVFISRTRGPDAIPRMLDAIRQGGGMGGALQAVGFDSMGDFEKEWMAHIRKTYAGRKAVERQFYRSRFKGDTKGSDESEGEGGVGSQAARQFVRLGDLFLQRGHPSAAAVEFDKAAQSTGVKNPVIQNRIAVALMGAGKLSQAQEALSGLDEMYPDFISTHMNQARISMRMGKPADSENHYHKAAEINPFDPEVWEGIASAAKERGDRKGYDEAVGNLRLIKTAE